MSQIVLEKGAKSSGGLPRVVLYAAIALVGFTLAASGFSKVSGIGAVRMSETRAVETIALKFEDQDDGGVAVVDARDGAAIYRVEPGTNGFIRATMRGLAQERRRDGVGDETPFVLTHWTDGTMSLEDPTDGRRIDLDAFGPTNAQAFAQLFVRSRSQ